MFHCFCHDCWVLRLDLERLVLTVITVAVAVAVLSFSLTADDNGSFGGGLGEPVEERLVILSHVMYHSLNTNLRTHLIPNIHQRERRAHCTRPAHNHK